MTIAARTVLPLALIATILIGVGILYPTLNGPFLLDCGDLQPTTCDQIWRDAAHSDSSLGLLPVTRVRITAASSDVSPDSFCGEIYLERWIFSTLIVNDCP